MCGRAGAFLPPEAAHDSGKKRQTRMSVPPQAGMPVPPKRATLLTPRDKQECLSHHRQECRCHCIARAGPRFPLDNLPVGLHYPASMPTVAQMTHFSAASLLLILGALGLYVASRAAMDALARRDPRPAPGRMALGHWTPIVMGSSMAAVAGRADLALGVLFGTTVASVSLAFGIITYLSPPGALPPSRRAWPFLLAAALLILIAGFGSRLTVTHALMLAALGIAVLAVWRGAAADDEGPVAVLLSDLAGPAPTETNAPPQQPAPPA